MLKNTFAVLVLLSCASAPAQVQEKEPVWAFKFQDYAVTQVFKGKPARPIVALKALRMFRTVIHDAAAKGPNFAGHYTIAIWGCGSSCAQMAVVDALTGHLYQMPFDSISMDVPVGEHDYAGPVYQLKSRLFIADGCPNEGDTNCGTYYYEWTTNKFKLLRFDPRP